jgi:hypothetical protein
MADPAEMRTGTTNIGRIPIARGIELSNESDDLLSWCHGVRGIWPGCFPRSGRDGRDKSILSSGEVFTYIGNIRNIPAIPDTLAFCSPLFSL